MGASGGPTIVTDSSLKLLIDPKDDVCNGGKSTMTDLAGTDDATVYSGMSVKLGTIEYASDTSIDMAIGDSYSITFWVNKQGSNSGNYAQILDNYASIRNWAVGNWINTDQLFFEWRRADNAAWTATQLSLNLVQDEWNFLAITVTSGGAGGTKTIVTRLYNSAGAPTTTTKTTTDDWSDSGTGNFHIGRSQSNSTYFNGEVSDVRVYKGVLSLSDINTIYNRPNRVLPGVVSGSQLVGWWPLIEGSGTGILDNSSNSNNGTLTNDPTWVSASADIPQTATGFEVSSSLVSNPNEGWFDFSHNQANGGDWTNYLLAGNSTDLLDAANDATYTFWFNRTHSSGEYERLIGRDDHLVVDIKADDDFRVLVYRTGATDDWVGLGAASYDTDTWYHIGLTTTRNDYNRLYLDGVLMGTDATHDSALNTKAGHFGIGQTNHSSGTGALSSQHQLRAKVTAVQVYDRALSAKEILQNYNAMKSRFIYKVNTYIKEVI